MHKKPKLKKLTTTSKILLIFLIIIFIISVITFTTALTRELPLYEAINKCSNSDELMQSNFTVGDFYKVVPLQNGKCLLIKIEDTKKDTTLLINGN